MKIFLKDLSDAYLLTVSIPKQENFIPSRRHV